MADEKAKANNLFGAIRRHPWRVLFLLVFAYLAGVPAYDFVIQKRMESDILAGELIQLFYATETPDKNEDGTSKWEADISERVHEYIKACCDEDAEAAARLLIENGFESRTITAPEEITKWRKGKNGVDTIITTDRFPQGIRLLYRGLFRQYYVSLYIKDHKVVDVEATVGFQPT